MYICFFIIFFAMFLYMLHYLKRHGTRGNKFGSDGIFLLLKLMLIVFKLLGLGSGEIVDCSSRELYSLFVSHFCSSIF